MKFFYAILVSGFFLSAFAPNSFAADLPTVAVVSLDLPVNHASEESVLKTLANADVNVISSEELQERLEKARSPKPSDEIAGSFVQISQQVSKGIEAYFYENEKKAIKILQPIFDLGMNNIEVLARRPDYADQVFQAGIILTRAYAAKRKKDNAKAVISLMVRNFPTKLFLASVIPPKLIKKLEKARAEMAEEGTTLTLSSRGEKSRCVAYVNGFRADLNKPIAVKSNTNYHLRLDCGTNDPIVWRTLVPAGESLVVPLTEKNPMIVGIKADSLTARQEAENALMAIMFWASIDHIVGVSEHLTENGRVLVVRIQKGASPSWSDGAKNEDVYKALVRVFPELELEMVDAPDESMSARSGSNGSTDWLGWTFVGTGLATAGGATFLIVTALDKQKEIECSTDSRPKSECVGVNHLDPESKEFKQDADAVDTRILASYGLYGVSAVLIGYGTYRLLTHEDPKEEAFHFSPTLSPNGGVGVQLHTRF